MSAQKSVSFHYSSFCYNRETCRCGLILRGLFTDSLQPSRKCKCIVNLNRSVLSNPASPKYTHISPCTI